jgi:acylphosphatase
MDGQRLRSVEAIVHGYVQGVGFRWFVAREAAALDVGGWVLNRRDGTVEVVAEGPADEIKQLLDVLREGPPGADVRSVDVTERVPSGTHCSFEIRSGWHSGD